MDTYRNIYFEVVQIGDKLTIRATLVRQWLFFKRKVILHNYFAKQHSMTDQCKLSLNFRKAANCWYETTALEGLKITAEACQQRYSKQPPANTKVLYSTKPEKVDNFDKIHSLTLDLIAASKAGNNGAEGVILKQLEALHNGR